MGNSSPSIPMHAVKKTCSVRYAAAALVSAFFSHLVHTLVLQFLSPAPHTPGRKKNKNKKKNGG